VRPVGPTAVVDGWEVSTLHSGAALTISDQTPLSKVLVRADEAALVDGVGFGRSSRREDGVLVVGSGPGEWLLIGPVGQSGAIASALAGSMLGFATVVDLTHGRALLRLTGDDGPQVLAKVCAIDLRPDVTPNGSAFRSAVAALVTDVVRDDLPDGTRSYLLHCERSSGQHLFDSLVDAGAELKLEIDGFSISA
jgi:heterotetrameric sarcosine oxidase gamma subunit